MQDYNDMVVEVLEVFFNHILYVRDIYPSQIFKKRRIYNSPVYVSVYPPLNAYLLQVLKALKELLKSCQLISTEMLLYKDEYKRYESYKFYISIGKNTNPEDEFLLDLEGQLRSSLSTLADRLKGLEKLPSDAKFRILVHTTQNAFMKLTHISHYQEFPWLQTDLKPVSNMKEISLLPLTHVKCVDLNISAEIF